MILPGQEVMDVGPPLTIVVVGTMVMPLVVRDGFAAVGHCRVTIVSREGGSTENHTIPAYLLPSIKFGRQETLS